MRILFDTSFLVEIDRNNEKVIKVMRKVNKEELFIATVTISEILTGSFLTQEKKSVRKGVKVLSQFSWIELDWSIAKETGKILASRIEKGKPAEYQDSVIAASFKALNCDYLLTENKDHFNLDFLRDKVFTPEEFLKKLESG